MLNALVHVKNDITVAYVVFQDEKYEDNVYVVGNAILKKNLDIGYNLSFGNQKWFIKKGNDNCAEIFYKYYIPSIKGQGDYKFLETKFEDLPIEIKSQLKVKNKKEEALSG